MGSSKLLDRLLYSSCRSCGTLPGESKTGTLRYWPVMGGSSFSSRDNKAITAAKLPPADDPPTIRPFRGLAFSVSALETAHFTASQQSLTLTGNGYSGASLKTLLMRAVKRCKTRTCNRHSRKRLPALSRTFCNSCPHPSSLLHTIHLRETSILMDFRHSVPISLVDRL